MDAWKLAGGGAESYKARIEKNPLFRKRVEILELEREKLEQEGSEGEVLWAVKQNWRLQRAAGDPAGIHRATVLLVQTMTQLRGGGGAGDEGGVSPGGSATGDVPAPGRPGRPAIEPRAVKADISRMKSELLAIGVPQPVVADEP